MFGKFEIHKTSDQTASDVFDVRCVVCLTGFIKHVWRAHAYYDADFGHTQPRCPTSFPKSAVESVFDYLFDRVWLRHQTRGKLDILRLTGA